MQIHRTLSVEPAIVPFSKRCLGVWLTGLACMFVATMGWAADRQQLKGHVPAAVARLAPVGRLDETARLHLAVAMPVRNPQGLTQLLHDLYDPKSPNYRKFLTSAQFTAQFGPTDQDYEALIQFAQANGLAVTATHPNRVILDVEGSVADIEKTLHVTLRTYQHPTEPRTFYAPDVEPSIDAPVAVLNITGLDNYALPHPNLVPRPAVVGGHANAVPSSGSGPSGNYGGGDFRAAYVPGTTLTGTGQSVALLEYDGYYASDITAYAGQFSLPAIPLVNVAVNGGITTPGTHNDEVALDIEMVMSMAPGVSTIYIYEAPQTASWVDILSRMANDNLSSQLSCSWSGGGANPAGEVIFQQMATQGQSFFNAVGDTDAFTGAIPFPSDSPNITEVGGTTLTTTGAGGSYTSETVWNWNNNTGTCGGISPTYSIPTWQQGVSMATNQGSTSMRNVPDVALTADNIWVDYNNGSSGSFGGTSCAAPLWAAFTALVNQQAVANGQPTVGFLNPTLYNIGLGANYNANFHDTTTGNNFSTSSPTKFSAATSFDLCTGWGTPLGGGLLFTLGGPFIPTIASFTPASGLPTASVTITGTNFYGVTNVAFNGVSATFTVNSPTQITATVPSGATTGPITVTTPGGVAISATNFAVISFSPALGTPGTVVTLTGAGFTHASAVSFNGVNAATFTVNSDTQITVMVPAAATSGPISVTTPGVVITSGNSFAVLTGDGTPTISSFTPASGVAGVSVTITGTNFVNVSGVSFNGVAATFTVNSQTQITAVVPAPSSGDAGFISVTTSQGTATSGNAFAIGLAAVFNSATSVPVTAAGFTATGAPANFTLNYAPAAGTNLTVVKNTGLGFINGAFSNLVQGQAVPLTYGGITYNFMANYYGGTGNDLVLQWANSSPVAWGLDNYGQLGNNNPTSFSLPVAVNTSSALSGKTVKALSAGLYHSVALCTDGTLAAWGYNGTGQLGNNSTNTANVPVAISTAGTPLASTTVTAMASGYSHSLALCANGTVAAWGANVDGQLGNGSATESNVPVAVTTKGTALASKTVTALAAGSAHSLALCSDGTLAAWGDNGNGQLGNRKTTNSSVAVAVRVTGTPLSGTKVVAVSAGQYHNIALCANGVLATWGYNGYGQLGNNSTTQSDMPVAVTTTSTPLAGRTVIAVAAGGWHCLALCSDGTLAAWGYNGFGQLGNNSTTNSSVPVAVTTAGTPLAGKTIIAIAAGYDYSLALCADGTVAVWGYNSDGELGNGSSINSLVPVAITTADTTLADRTVSAVSVGGYHNLALCADGTLAAWGSDVWGQLGNGIVLNSPAPVAVTTASTPLYGETITAESSGGYHTLAVCADGTLAAWGDNSYGQLGNNTTTNSSVPLAVTTTGTPLATKSVVAVSTGLYHSLALCSDGTLAAWGYNVFGQLGNGSTTNSSVPIAVTTAGTPLAGKTVVAISAGLYHSLALCSDGTAVAWGYNVYGQLGNNTTTTSTVPVAVTPLSGKTFISVVAGQWHSLAVCSDNTLAAWGENNDGQLGNSTTTNSSVPVAVNTSGVLSGKTVIAAAAGYDYSLALCADGILAGWGYNAFGELGNNTTSNSSVPVAVTTTGTPLAGKLPTAISAGQYHSLAICADGTLATWGYDGDGELGNNGSTNSLLPVAVSTALLSAGENFALPVSGQSASHSLALISGPPLPVATTSAATAITNDGATLSGTVSADNNSTTVSFQYGTSPSFTNTVSGVPGIVTGNSATTVNAILSNLLPGTIYYFRVVAVNGAGTTYGPTETFTTAAGVPAMPGWVWFILGGTLLVVVGHRLSTRQSRSTHQA